MALLSDAERVCPAVFIWLQEFNEPKEKVFIQLWATDTVRITHIDLWIRAE